MKLTIDDARKNDKFAHIFNHLKPFTNNVVIYFKPTGLYIQCMDDGRCVLLECVLDKTWFTTYEFAPETDMPSISLCINMFYKVLNTREDKQTLEIELDPDDEDKCIINFEGGNTSKHFELPLINVDHDLLNVTTVGETFIDLTMEIKVFCDLIQQLMIFDEILTLTFNEENISMKSSGHNGSMKVAMDIEDITEYAIAEGGTLTQSYSLKYIHYMCQFNKLATEIQMGFSQDKPMTMKYDLLEDSYVLIHLAPKITDE